MEIKQPRPVSNDPDFLDGIRITEAPCNLCGGLRKHRIIGESEKIDSEVVSGTSCTVEWRQTRHFLECCGCRSPILRLVEWFSDAAESEKIIYFPPREKFRFQNEGHPAPERVLLIFSQSISAFNQDLFLLAAAGLRTTVEMICDELSIAGGQVDDWHKPGQKKFSKNLDGKINGLAEKNFLTLDQANRLHHHRFLGNDAVHEAMAPTESALRACFDILVTILDLIWKHPKQAQILESGRNPRNF